MVGAASFVVLVAGPGKAAGGGSCADVRVDSAPGLGVDWEAAVRQLREELATLSEGRCQPAVLSIVRDHAVVRIVATNEDGRRTERTISNPAALRPTALGLVLTIPALALDDQASAQGSADLGPAEKLARPAVDADHAPVGTRGPNEVWLGLGAGARIAAPTSASMADVEGRADLFLGDWLLFVAFRYAPIGIIVAMRSDPDAYHEITVALGVGRIVRVGRTTLDFDIAPTLVASRMEGDRGREDDDDDDVKQSDVQFRIDASMRWMLPLSKKWRLTVTADWDLAPTDASGPLRLDARLPAFPSWTAGLRFGASGALL
jgi:hypothetical protein